MIENLVTTVIPVFNRPAMLQEAVDSVLAQTWRPIEIVIVDDGSTDGTLAAAQELASRHRDIVRVTAQSNAGPGAARQAGVTQARGEFVQFLDSDDRLLPDKFSKQVAGLRADAEAGISYCQAWIVQDGARNPARAAETIGQRQVFPALLSGRLWETSAPLYRRSALDVIGSWPARRQMEDWTFDAQAGAARVPLHYCNDFLAEYRIHGEHRLAHAWLSDDGAMRDRAQAFVDIMRLARKAGVAQDAPEMRRFARTLFMEARTAGARGLSREAEELLALATQASAGQRGRLIELGVYRCLVKVFGDPAAARIGEYVSKRASLSKWVGSP